MSYRTSKPPEAPGDDPCVRCNRPSECEVWGHRLCYNCTARWELAADESLPCTSSATAHLDFTRAWLAREKRGAA
jgi:hypothetical protein